MVHGAPAVAPDVLAVPNLRRPRGGGGRRRPSLRRDAAAETSDDTVFGSLCAVVGRPRTPALAESYPLIGFVGRVLSTVLAQEALAADRSAAAAQAYALVDRDPLTELANGAAGTACWRPRAGAASASARRPVS